MTLNCYGDEYDFMIHSCGRQPLHGDLKRAVRLGIAVKYVEDEGAARDIVLGRP